MLTASSRAAAAAPTSRTAALRWGGRSTGAHSVADLRLHRLLKPRRLARLGANLAVLGLVLILPFAASNPAAPAQGSTRLVEGYGLAAARAEAALLSSGRSPVTTLAEGTRPIQSYTIGKADTLGSIASFYKVSPEALAYSNGISDPLTLQVGQQLQIPPGPGALYTVQAGDSVEAVAAKFRVDPKVIMSYNRLYFEPEHFAPGQLIFVEGATVPGLVYQTVTPARAPVVATIPISQPFTPGGGALAWPVGGNITQRFRAGHLGVDIAAPYGTGIAVPLDGTVVSTGWVAVGGLSVRVRHDNGLVTGYYHTSSVYVTAGQRVRAGQVVAAIGLTGVTTGPHVHWECQMGGALVDCLSVR
ncbi:MAG: M23 family metallopeptidase [Chloroflexi bacterium]|nr:M23 family metallopeptidase [Chloroflexota bacterium]